jgi:formylglycine-generating enzyme required for sulfatase activity
MKTKIQNLLLALALLAGAHRAHSAAVQMGIKPAGKNVLLSWPATATNYVLQSTTNLAPANWLTVSNVVPVLVNNSFTVTVTNTARARFFRLYNIIPIASPDMALIPAGSFTMGNCMDPNEGGADSSYELPLHTNYVSAFYMDQYDVTYALWQQVHNWATNHGYSFDHDGSGKATNHPVQMIDWYDSVKWCNARSEMEGRTPAYYMSAAQTVVYRSGTNDLQNDWVKWNAGYRLPTEAEWEKAARGGASGQRFPWGNTISWSQANYQSFWYNGAPYFFYDLATASSYDPTFNDGVNPFTSPVDYFAPNGYGLYDMAGNVWQWCWDWFGSYSSASQTDPRGPTSGSIRVYRGGSYFNLAINSRSACRVTFRDPTYSGDNHGFRSVLPPGQ